MRAYPNKQRTNQRKSTSAGKRHAAGFTLIELLTVLATSAIIASAAIPSFAHLINRHRLAQSINELAVAMAQGRSEAIGRGQRIALAPREDNAWNSGWQLFIDRNNNGVQDADEPTLREFQMPHAGMQARAWGAPAQTRISFNNDGFIRRAGGNGLAMGGISLSYRGQARSVCIAAARVRVVKGDGCG